MSILAWNGGPADYDVFWDRIRNAATPQEEVRYLFRLPLFPLHRAAVAHAGLDADGDPHPERRLCHRLLHCQPLGGTAGVGLADRPLGRSHHPLPENFHGYMLEGISRLTDAESVRDVPAFLEEHPIAAARRRIAQLLERQQINAAFARASGRP